MWHDPRVVRFPGGLFSQIGETKIGVVFSHGEFSVFHRSEPFRFAAFTMETIESFLRGVLAADAAEYAKKYG